MDSCLPLWCSVFNRSRIKSSEIEGVVWKIAAKLNRKKVLYLPMAYRNLVHSGSKYSSSVPDKVINTIVDDLIQNKGKSILVAGPSQPSTVHSLIYLMNQALGNHNRAVKYFPIPFSSQKLVQKTNQDSISELTRLISVNKISSLFILGGDPVYNAPSDLKFKTQLEKVKNVVHLTKFKNQTSQVSHWVLPESHFLESWGDVVAKDGTKSLIQPLISPMYESISAIELMGKLSGVSSNGYVIVRRTWRSQTVSGRFESNWQKWVRDGLIQSGRLKGVTYPLSNQGFETSLKKRINAFKLSKGIEVVFESDSSVYDGRFINNGWLQELPDPLSKLTWDNAALVSHATSQSLGVENEQMIQIEVSGNKLMVPVWIQPGHADNAITLLLGYGQENSGRIGQKTGFNVYPLRSSNTLHWAMDVSVTPHDKTYKLASTQDHGSMEGRPLYREATAEEFKKHPNFAQEMVETPPLKSLFDERPYDTGNQWGMVIDLDKCTGCNACVVGCQSENNIPIVGKKEVLNGREMHWIRIDRYYEGDINDPKVYEQPVTCLQCENAPCEQVCPVAATTHSEEGLNDMTYNRCVGTRYCADNCPAKVRRFNFLDYHQKNPQSVKKDRVHLFDYVREPDPKTQMQFNPNVTVRMRGIMEKCTYCVQRISKVKSNAANNNREIRDGEIQTACQQACPAEAISFGNILDKKSKVAKMRKKKRNYTILEQLHLKARTSYLANIRNPNSKLSKPSKKQKVHS